jgi:hypothetical protein
MHSRFSVPPVDRPDSMVLSTPPRGYEVFRRDVDLQGAVLWRLETPAEATGKLSQSLKDRHPARWRAIYGFRNIAAHGYLGLGTALHVLPLISRAPVSSASRPRSAFMRYRRRSATNSSWSTVASSARPAFEDYARHPLVRFNRVKSRPQVAGVDRRLLRSPDANSDTSVSSLVLALPSRWRRRATPSP